MSLKFLKNCLDALAKAEDDDEVRYRIVHARVPKLMSAPETIARLAADLAQTDQPDDDQTLVLAAMIDEAARDQENGGVHGPRLLAALKDALEEIDPKKTIGRGLLTVGGCYAQAKLDPPEALMSLIQIEAANAVPDEEAGMEQMVQHMGDLLGTLAEESEGESYALHDQFNQMLASLPEEAYGMIVAMVASRPEPVFTRVVAYWLLDRRSSIRAAAAETMLEQAKAGTLPAATAAILPAVRAWSPADAARATLDKAIKAAMRRDAAEAPAPWTQSAFYGSPPDGAGAQSFAVACQRGSERCVAMLLLKQELGVKDAFILPCEKAADQRKTLEEVVEQAGMSPTSAEHLRAALGAAVAEGLAAGAPPAHGMIDAAEACGLQNLTPQARTAADWIAALDPNGEFAAMSPQKLGRLLNQADEALDEAGHITDSWFEYGEEFHKATTFAIHDSARTKAIWKLLRDRRAWWTLMIAKTAALMQSGEADWRPLAATAYAADAGRDLTKTALFRRIFENSMEQAPENPFQMLRAQLSGMDEGGDPLQALTALLADEDDDFGDDDFDDDFDDEEDSIAQTAEPEKRGEFNRLLKQGGFDVASEWVDGYLAAIAASPAGAEPQPVVEALIDHGALTDEDALRRFVEILVLRYNALWSAFDDEDFSLIEPILARKGAFSNWAAGFHAAASTHKEAWPKRKLSKQDRSMLDRLAKAEAPWSAAERAELREWLLS